MTEKRYRCYDLPAARVFREEQQKLDFSFDELAEFLGVSLSSIFRLKHLDLLSFHMDSVGVGTISLDRLQLDELKFLSAVGRLDISDDLLKEMFFGLEKPYCFDRCKVSFDFSRMRWVSSGQEDTLRDLLCNAVDGKDCESFSEIYRKVMEAHKDFIGGKTFYAYEEAMSDVAIDICEKVKAQVIERLLSIPSNKLLQKYMIDTDDYEDFSNLKNAWEEVCVQAHEGSRLYEYYQGEIGGYVGTFIGKLKKHELFSVWLQTWCGQEWTTDGIPFEEASIDNDIVSAYIVDEYILPAAWDYNSENVEEHLGEIHRARYREDMGKFPY